MKITESMKRIIRAELGRSGGQARAEKYDKATLRKWGRKGGRPKKARRAKTKAGN